jgi:solute carrier family 25 phosphate transporter 23/24/25/41
MNPLQASREVLSQGGLANFYRGLKPTLFAVVPFIALQNTSIDLMRDHALSEDIAVSPLLLGAVGAGAGIVAQTVVYPLDVLRRRLQVTNTVSDQASKEVLSD